MNLLLVCLQIFKPTNLLLICLRLAKLTNLLLICFQSRIFKQIPHLLICLRLYLALILILPPYLVTPWLKFQELNLPNLFWKMQLLVEFLLDRVILFSIKEVETYFLIPAQILYFLGNLQIHCFQEPKLLVVYLQQKILLLKKMKSNLERVMNSL